MSGVPDLSEGSSVRLWGTSCAAGVMGWAGYGAEGLWFRKGGQLGVKNLVFPSETPKTLPVRRPCVLLQSDIVLSSLWVEN